MKDRPGHLLPRSFFERSPELVAPRLLGKVLVHRTHRGGASLAGRIVEVEAYLGPHNDPPDPAAHSHRGPTPRNAVLFGPAGHAYVYSIYGRYFCMNITCEAEGRAGCVLLRALEPVAGIGQDGSESRSLARCVPAVADFRPQPALPGARPDTKSAQRPRRHQSELTAAGARRWFRGHRGMVTVRIGIKHAVDWPLRFNLPGHPCVSGARNLTGTRLVFK